MRPTLRQASLALLLAAGCPSSQDSTGTPPPPGPNLCAGVVPVDDQSPCTRDTCVPSTGQTAHTYIPGCGESNSPPPSTLSKELVTLQGATFASYGGAADGFRVVCHEPCPIAEPVLLALHAGMSHGKRVLVQLAGIDVLPPLAPVDVHVTADPVCGPFSTAIGGYSTLGPDFRGRLCLFTWEWSHPPPPYLPRPLRVDTAVTLEEQMLFVHEYAHLLFFGRHYISHESVPRALSYHVSGFIVDPCDSRLVTYLAHLPYQLCTQLGFGFQHLAPSLRALDALYQAGKGEGAAGHSPISGGLPETTVYQWRQILDGLLGKDTLPAFLAADEYLYNLLGDTVTLTPAGGRFELYRGAVVLELPAGAVGAPVVVTTPPVFTLYAIPPGWENFAFSIAEQLEPAATVFARPGTLTLRYDPRYLPSGGAEDTLRLYAGASPMSLAVVGGSTVDVVAKTVSGPIDRLGTFFAAPGP